MSENPEITAERLAADICEVMWSGMVTHHEREGLYILDPQLDLAEVAAAVALDDAAKVKGWLGAKAMRRPTEEEVGSWEEEDDGTAHFRFLIVQPFVLAQRL